MLYFMASFSFMDYLYMLLSSVGAVDKPDKSNYNRLLFYFFFLMEWSTQGMLVPIVECYSCGSRCAFTRVFGVVFLPPNQADLKCLCCTPLSTQYQAVPEEQAALQVFHTSRQGFAVTQSQHSV